MTARKLTGLMILTTATAWACQVPEPQEPGAFHVNAPVTVIDAEPSQADDDGRKILGVIVVGGIIGTLLNGWLLAGWLTRRNKRAQSNRQHADAPP